MYRLIEIDVADDFAGLRIEMIPKGSGSENNSWLKMAVPADGIDAVMDKYRLDAIVGPSGGPAGTTDAVYGDRDVGGSSSPAAVAGYPNITVPAGQAFGLPVGLSFIGSAWSEPRLIGLAYAYEQATRHRRPPSFRNGTLP